MHTPTLDEFLKLATQGNLIPVTCRILADIETPLSAYRKIRGQGESFLFESVEGGEHLARYSFIGFSPRSVVKTGQTKATSKDPLVDVEKQLQGLRSFIIKGQPPFTGGAVGYVTYDE